MTNEEKTCQSVGPGGYKCPCCGPSPKRRREYRRMIRRRIKALVARRLRMDTE